MESYLLEIREVASAYYANSSNKVKEKASKFFKTMDTDGDGMISPEEFQAVARKEWPGVFKPELFSLLDTNKDGLLDIEESIVFFYMVHMRHLFCNGCHSYLYSVYFTCVKCFCNKKRDTYNLCLPCYRADGHSLHEHKEFLDNYAMLRAVPRHKFKAKDVLKSFGTQTGSNILSTIIIQSLIGI